jgi:hypothetical protein
MGNGGGGGGGPCAMLRLVAKTTKIARIALKYLFAIYFYSFVRYNENNSILLQIYKIEQKMFPNLRTNLTFNSMK